MDETRSLSRQDTNVLTRFIENITNVLTEGQLVIDGHAEDFERLTYTANQHKRYLLVFIISGSFWIDCKDVIFVGIGVQ